MLQYFVEYAGDAQEFLRRGWNHFKSFKTKEPLNIPDEATPEDITSSCSFLSLSRACKLPSIASFSRRSKAENDAASNAEAIKALVGKPTLSEKGRGQIKLDCILRLKARSRKPVSYSAKWTRVPPENLQKTVEQMSELISEQLENHCGNR